MRIWRNLFLLAVIACLSAWLVYTAQAQSGDEQQFPNGYTIKGEFFRFYHAAPDPELLFGEPISDEMIINGKRMQYFDRARFELTNTDKGPKIQLSNLGWMLYDDKQSTPANVPTNSPTCRYFPRKGYSVCYKLLQFYEANNGPVYFGDPISDAETRDGRVVQYFENARFEWRPNLPPDLQIGLTDLGRLAMQKYLGISPRREPLIVFGSEAPTFQVKAFVSQALVQPRAENSMFVVVQDLMLKPVAGAAVQVNMLLPTGSRELASVETNSDGFARITLPGVDLAPKEMVQIQVQVTYAGKTVPAATWYRVWY